LKQLCLFITVVTSLVSKAPYMFNESRPLILGHRGSPGLFPEHTHGSYSNAFTEEVDFVELDLQMTKDGHLVTSHDPCLKDTTDIEKYATKYADREGSWDFNALYGSHYNNDWLIRDFTLAELKTLRRNQRYSFRNHDLDGLFDIMTLEETIELMFKL
jgi:glycerophosphoryl diester phosphodiesterase